MKKPTKRQIEIKIDRSRKNLYRPPHVCVYLDGHEVDFFSPSHGSSPVKVAESRGWTPVDVRVVPGTTGVNPVADTIYLEVAGGGASRNHERRRYGYHRR